MDPWLVTMGLVALAPAPVATAIHGEDVRFEPVADAFPGEALGDLTFLVAACDMDSDGDDDVLVNKHNSAPLELWRNDGGRFERVPAERTGFDDHPKVPSLYATEVQADTAIDALVARGGAGLLVWHDADRNGPWRLVCVRGELASELVVELTTNRDVEAVEADGGQVERAERNEQGEQRLTWRLAPDEVRASLTLSIVGASQQLVVDTRASAETLHIHAGASFVPVGTRWDVWPPDPHGVAWWPSGAGALPELTVGRGGLKGTLTREGDPKRNRSFRWAGGERLYSRSDSLLLDSPPDWGRARQVQWVDLAGDGVPMLYVGNKTSSNALWWLDPHAEEYRDRAPQLGLDAFHGESFGWLDVDDDGFEDLLLLEPDDAVRGLRNVAGGRFEELDLAAFGIDLPGAPALGRPKLFETEVFHVTDFDADGRLDLWIGGYGPRRGHRLFLRRGDGFEDVTEAFGLADRPGRLRLSDRTRATLLIDADNDRFVDVLALRGGNVRLYHNRGEERFDALELELDGEPASGTGCVLDADRDGREDFVIGGPTDVRLVRNVTAHAGDVVLVELLEPTRRIGTVVTAHYSDGTAVAQRFGSARNPPFSQTFGPLRFGVPEGLAIEAIALTRRGEEQRFELRAAERSVALPR